MSKNNRFNRNKIARKLNFLISKRKQATRNLQTLLDQLELGMNRDDAIARVKKQIGRLSYQIDVMISKLINEELMSRQIFTLSNSYLLEEIRRNQQIINRWEEAIKKVTSGEFYFIDQDGNKTNGVEAARKYVEKKKRVMSKYQSLLHRLHLN